MDRRTRVLIYSYGFRCFLIIAGKCLLLGDVFAAFRQDEVRRYYYCAMILPPAGRLCLHLYFHDLLPLACAVKSIGQRLLLLRKRKSSAGLINNSHQNDKLDVSGVAMSTGCSHCGGIELLRNNLSRSPRAQCTTR